MSTEKSFTYAVCETPEDDAPRLVYADWLDDHRQPERAEFIRLQCRLATRDEWSDGIDELVAREKELLRVHGKKWSKATAKFTARVEFRRGFVEEMSLPVAKFVANADAIFAATPLLCLRPLQVKPNWEALVASPHLARLRTLDLHNSGLGVGRTQALVDCEHLSNLHELNLGLNGARGSATAIVCSPHLRQLSRLRLNNNAAGDELPEALADGKPFPHLRRLDLETNGITPDGARALARCGWLRQLEDLALAHNPIGDAGVEALAASGVWSNHRRLSLRDCSVTAVAGRHLARCPPE